MLPYYHVRLWIFFFNIFSNTLWNFYSNEIYPRSANIFPLQLKNFLIVGFIAFRCTIIGYSLIECLMKYFTKIDGMNAHLKYLSRLENGYIFKTYLLSIIFSPPKRFQCRLIRIRMNDIKLLSFYSFLP